MDRLLRFIPTRIGSEPMTPVKKFRPKSRPESRKTLAAAALGSATSLHEKTNLNGVPHSHITHQIGHTESWIRSVKPSSVGVPAWPRTADPLTVLRAADKLRLHPCPKSRQKAPPCWRVALMRK
jgi:hypothetical protein